MGPLLLSSCGTVAIKDSEWCGDMGRDGAACFHTLTTASRDLSPPQWDYIRYGQLCTPASTFADWKAAIEKLCSVSGKCTYQMKQGVNTFMKNVKKVTDTN